MKKLSNQINEQEYLAIVIFFISMLDFYEGAVELIAKERIMVAFQLDDKFTNTLSMNEYEDNERGFNHLLWCWTLILMRQICTKMLDVDNMKYYSVFNSVIDFIISHEKRFVMLLENTDYVDSLGNHIHKSLAYLEELEYVTNLLNVLYVQAKKWKSSYMDFYNRFINIILTKTLRLYLPNIKISNHFKHFSNMEKMMNDVKLTCKIR